MQTCSEWLWALLGDSLMERGYLRGPALLVTLDGSSLEPACRARPSPHPVPAAAARSMGFCGEPESRAQLPRKVFSVPGCSCLCPLHAPGAAMP